MKLTVVLCLMLVLFAGCKRKGEVSEGKGKGINVAEIIKAVHATDKMLEKSKVTIKGKIDSYTVLAKENTTVITQKEVPNSFEFVNWVTLEKEDKKIIALSGPVVEKLREHRGKSATLVAAPLGYNENFQLKGLTEVPVYKVFEIESID